MDQSQSVKLRVLTLRDLKGVADIDESLLGTRRENYWEDKLEKAETRGVPSLAAEVNGKVVGFILGNVSGWEYGVPENVAYIDTLGVKKEYNRRGIARLLIKEMFSMFKKVGVDTVYVFVNKDDQDFLNFFEKIGFKNGNMINLEMKI
ncbi:MAG TPA: GNAT family N-acetyltransferase [Syntrophorhabdaceae bacterium]|nr:GNAT family N-acetyltransferase [Syntrophorhabdaceae bacterium]